MTDQGPMSELAPIAPGTRVQILDRSPILRLRDDADAMEDDIMAALGLVARAPRPPDPPVFGVVRKLVDRSTDRYRVAHMDAYKFAIYNRDELVPIPVLDPCLRCRGEGINIIHDIWTCSACKGAGERVRPILTSWQRLVEED